MQREEYKSTDIGEDLMTDYRNKIDNLFKKYCELRELEQDHGLLRMAVVDERKSIVFNKDFFDFYECKLNNRKDRTRAIFQYTQDLDLAVINRKKDR